MTSRADEAVAFATEIFGRPVDRVERMVKSSVRAIRLHVGDQAYVASRRDTVDRAKLEETVLTQLHAHGAPVPQCIGRRERWVFQENLDGDRLTVRLWKSVDDPHDLMQRGLEALRKVHDAGRSTDLRGRIPRLGMSDVWQTRLAMMPTRIAEVTGVDAPPLDVDAIGGRLAPASKCALKWDARPANAMVRPDGRVFWFDWEHCGVRDPLDDAAWFLGDEYAPQEGPDASDGLAALRDESYPRSVDQSLQYLLRFGVLHITVRLALILQKRDEYNGWRDWDMSLNLDKVGCTAEAFRRTASRAAAWSAESDDLRVLEPWFRNLVDWCPDD